VNANQENDDTMQTTELSPLSTAIKRLAITKDQRRVLLALADAGDWTPMPALETLLGKSKDAVRRMAAAVTFLIEEHLVETGSREGVEGMFLRARAVEQWDKDEHFLLGIAIAWP
jgi:hypothetical protein